MLAAKGPGGSRADAAQGGVCYSGKREQVCVVVNSESSSAGLTCPGYGRGAGTRGCVCVCVCVYVRARARVPQLTLTRGSVRLVHTAISSRMLMSG